MHHQALKSNLAQVKRTDRIKVTQPPGHVHSQNAEHINTLQDSIFL